MAPDDLADQPEPRATFTTECAPDIIDRLRMLAIDMPESATVRAGIKVLVEACTTIKALREMNQSHCDDERRMLAAEAALRSAIKIADEARDEWDKAPSGMRAGKIIIALSGRLPGYRADIDAIHAALIRPTNTLPDAPPAPQPASVAAGETR